MAKSSFDLIGNALGTGGKTEGDCGKEFAQVWADDRETAVRYLRNDVAQPAEWLERMGLLNLGS